LINLRFKKHQVYVARHYPGITPEQLTRLTLQLFNRYTVEAEKYAFGKPIQWTDPKMLKFLAWKFESTTLGLEVDKGNENGLVVERTLLRWVRDNVRGMGDLDVPFGLQDSGFIRRGNVDWDRF
jgi:hypothetical protein